MVELHTSDGERSSRTREMGGGSAFPSSQFDCSRGTCNLYVSTCASSNRAIDLGRDWTLPLRFNQLGHLYWSSCYTVCRVVVAVGRSVGWLVASSDEPDTLDSLVRIDTQELGYPSGRCSNIDCS